VDFSLRLAAWPLHCSKEKLALRKTRGGGGRGDGNLPQQTLPYSQDCKDPNGRRYDNPTNPAKILLCQNACTNVQKDKSGKIDVVFGCKTSGLPTN
jgi:hypothetical protein